MRHVVETYEVAWLWVRQAQSDARNRQGNFYFSGDTIYSYGQHFPIARHVKTRYGKPAVLVTTAEYGPTTAKHKREVYSRTCGRFAKSGINKVFYVAYVKAETKSDHIGNYDVMIENARRLAESAKRARSRASHHYHDAQTMLMTANDYSRTFGLGRRKVEINSLVSAEDLAGIRRRSGLKESLDDAFSRHIREIIAANKETTVD